MDRPPRRKSMRLQGWDYRRPGAYFVTICTHRRACLFGEIVDDEIRLNACGEMIQATWREVPNHVHGIIFIESVGAVPRGRPSRGRLDGQAHRSI